MVIALAVATWQATRAARRLPPTLLAIRPEQLADFTCLALLGGVVGGRLFYVVLEWEWFRRNPWELFAIWHGGLVWYGGFLGGLIAGWSYARAKRLAWLRVIDQLIPFLALGHAIGRLGCFLNGCCYGRPTDAWWGVVFPDHAEAVLPTQLVEAAGLFLLYGVLRWLQRPRLLARPGGLLARYLMGYGLLRFGMEFLRGDQTIWWAGLTLQQLISLSIFIVGSILYKRANQVRGVR